MAKAGLFRDQPGWYQDGTRPVYRGAQDASYFAGMLAVQGILAAVRARDLVGLGLTGTRWGLGRVSAEDRDRIDSTLDAVGALPFAERRMSTLSGGQQQRVAIAQALVGRPEVLLLDEPLAGMGAEEAALMVDLLRRLAPRHAILLVEHDMDAVFRVSDRITVMVNGEVIASDTPAAIRANPQVQVAYLGEHA